MRAMSQPRTALRPVKVQVAGQTLALRTDATASYLRELAALVDQRLAEVRERHAGSRPASTQALALLCALQLADDLRQAEQRERALRREVAARTARILEHLDDLAPTAPPAPRGRRRRASELRP